MAREHHEKPMYRLRPIDIFMFLAEGAAAGTAVCWLCYNSICSAPVGAVISAAFFLLQKREKEKKMRRELLYHFREFIAALHTAIRAGYSLENGIISAAGDIRMLYGEKDLLYRELKKIISQMKVRIKTEDLFLDLGKRSELDDIRMFAELLSIVKRTGGDMNRMLLSTSDILCDKIDTKQEIDAQIAAKAFEQKIMSLTPACIIVYLRVSFSGLIENLYGSYIGATVMTVNLIIYIAAFVWGRKIIDIEVC